VYTIITKQSTLFTGSWGDVSVVKRKTYLSINFKNTLQRSVFIRSDDQGVKKEDRIIVLSSLQEKTINIRFVEELYKIREILFFGEDQETSLEVALNGQQNLMVNHVTVINVHPIGMFILILL